MQPDRLAELHVLRELDASPEFSHACLTNLDARQALRAVTLLARASSDYVEAEDLLSQTLPAVADLIADTQAPAETLMAIFNAIPYPTVVLAPAAATLGQRIASRLPAGTEPAVRAYWLSNLGLRLAELGRPADALPLTQEAVTIYRELAAANPDRYRPDLAAIPEQPRHPVLRAGPTRRCPAGHPGGRRDPPGAGRCQPRPLPSRPRRIPEQPRRPVLRAGPSWPRRCRSPRKPSPSRRELAAASPDRYRPDLATSLSNLGIRFSELGRPAEALPVTEEAVTIYRELAAASPDRYRPDLAAVPGQPRRPVLRAGPPGRGPAGHRGSRRHPPGAGRRQPRPLPPRPRRIPEQPRRPVLRAGPPAAGPAGHRGSRRHPPGTGRRQPRPLPPRPRHVADNLGVRLSELGRPPMPCRSPRKPSPSHRELAAANPDRYRPDLAQSLTNLGEVLEAVGRKADADAARDEAAKLQLRPDR